jgi:AcrR family transcriptional regulator
MEDQGPEGGKGTGADAGARQRTEMAMLELSGESGFRAVSLDRLLARSAATVEQFDSWFADLDECFAAAYRAEADALCEAMLAASEGAREWRAGVEAGLTVLLRFTAARPDVARALVREAHVVGGESLAKHEEVMKRLAAAMDQRCERSEDVALPRAASFIVGAVEGVIAGHLDRGQAQELLAAMPELMDLIAAFFIGDESG